MAKQIVNQNDLGRLARDKINENFTELYDMVIETLYVSPNGDNSDGSTWDKAYKTIQGALTASSVNVNDMTLILIAPGDYDINTTGDPTWACNIIMCGFTRDSITIVNNHVSATSVLKLTGKVKIYSLVFEMGTSNNGLILTRGGSEVNNCGIHGQNLTSEKVGLWLDGTTAQKYVKVSDCSFRGNITYSTGLLVDQFADSHFDDLRFHNCLNGVQIVGADSDYNDFYNFDIGECAIGINIDAGNEQHIGNVQFHHNTVNIDDEVGDHIYDALKGDFPVTITPTDLVGVTLTANALANLYGADTEIVAAGAIDKPFRIVGVYLQPNIAQWYQVRFSWGGAGTQYFDQVLIKTARAAGSALPTGTVFIFNKGTRISASVKAISGGSDEIYVWLKLQLV